MKDQEIAMRPLHAYNYSLGSLGFVAFMFGVW